MHTRVYDSCHCERSKRTRVAHLKRAAVFTRLENRPKQHRTASVLRGSILGLVRVFEPGMPSARSAWSAPIRHGHAWGSETVWCARCRCKMWQRNMCGSCVSRTVPYHSAFNGTRETHQHQHFVCTKRTVELRDYSLHQIVSASPRLPQSSAARCDARMGFTRSPPSRHAPKQHHA